VRAQKGWLADWVVYAAMAEAEGVRADAPLAFVERPRPKKVPAELAASVAVHEGLQFLFATQWQALREHAGARGIRLLGDVPLFVSGDGCDVWTNPSLFRRGADGRLDPIAGVPPDYFSPLGQRWGNPTYDWDAHGRDGYAWWVARLRRELELVDLVRIDHFRGLAAYWAIAADEPDARRGQWVPGPGQPLFDALREGLDGLPLVAEDLGEITPDVIALREAVGLPGMKVLQFAFGGGSDHPFLPHNYDSPNWVVYTGTHDNDTAVGWYRATDEAARHRFRRYGARDGSDPAWAMMREAWASVAELAVAPMQDILGLDSGARMNTPGVARGNWGWRLRDLPWERTEMLRQLAITFGRAGLADEG
jgi:4-alpha-glucanotransferase